MNISEPSEYSEEEKEKLIAQCELLNKAIRFNHHLVGDSIVFQTDD